MLSHEEVMTARDRIFQHALFDDGGVSEDYDEAQTALAAQGKRIMEMFQYSALHVRADRLQSPRGRQYLFDVFLRMNALSSNVSESEIARFNLRERDAGRYCQTPYMTMRAREKAKALTAIEKLVSHVIVGGKG